jgi:hypothetical protein
MYYNIDDFYWKFVGSTWEKIKLTCEEEIIKGIIE